MSGTSSAGIPEAGLRPAAPVDPLKAAATPPRASTAANPRAAKTTASLRNWHPLPRRCRRHPGGLGSPSASLPSSPAAAGGGRGTSVAVPLARQRLDRWSWERPGEPVSKRPLPACTSIQQRPTRACGTGRDRPAAAGPGKEDVMPERVLAVLAQQPGGAQGGFKVEYSPDWSLFAQGDNLTRTGLNLLAAVGLVACTGFFIWGAILAAGGVSSQIPHNVARGKHQMFVSAMCALAIGVGAVVINTFFAAGQSTG